MKREDWRRAYEPLPDALERRVAFTLAHLKEKQPVKKLTFRTVVLVAALVLALGGVAYAVIESRTADLFGWFYGEDMKNELLAGDIASSGQSTQLGDVVYTLDEVIYKDGHVYGSGSISPAQGANVVLIAEDYSVNDAAGYLVYYGPEDIPEDFKSYSELAEERGAKLLLAKCVANGVVNPDGSVNASEIGYTQLPQLDGSIRFTFEFEGGMAGDGKAYSRIERAQSYDVNLHIANWEITTDGVWLRDEGNWLKDDWTVTVTPQMKGE